MREVMEESNGSERSKEWYNIYNIVKQIPRKEVNCDAVDASSAATMIEQLFLNEKMMNTKLKKKISKEYSCPSILTWMSRKKGE